MRAFDLGIVFSSLLFAVTSLNGQTQEKSVIDIIPDCAVMAFAANNFEELLENVNSTCNDLKDENGYLESTPQLLASIIQFAKKETGLADVIDSKSAVATIMMEPDNFDWHDSFMVLPITNMEKAAKIIGIDEKKLTNGNIIDLDAIESDFDGGYPNGNYEFVCRQGNFLWLSTGKEQLVKAVNSKPIRHLLTKDEIDTYSKQDIVITARPKDVVEQGGRKKFDFYSDMLGNLVESEEIEFGLMGIRLKNGVGFSVTAKLDEEANLAKLSASGSTSSLAKLPDGKMMAATCATGSDKLPETLSKLIESDLFVPLVQYGSKDQIPQRLQSNLFRVFNFAWNQIEETKFAVYLNDEPDKSGLTTVVTIIECKDAKQFLEQMVSMENFINSSLLPKEVSSASTTVSQEEIDQLISDLAAAKFQVRELATTKLTLLGDAAVKSLKNAIHSNDVELQARAKAILESFEATKLAAERDAIKFDPYDLKKFQIQFAFQSAQETVQDVSVSHVRLHFPEDNHSVTTTKQQLVKVFGPDWNKIRLIKLNDTLAFVWGSQSDFLDKVVKNLKTSNAGLGDRKRFEPFYERSKIQSTAQVHVSLSQMRHLIFDDVKLKPRDKTNSATSFGVNITSNRIQMNAHFSIDELQIMIDEWDRRN